jgi:hypothetical protein
MSITKLAEYVIASPRRRRSILRDQRYPPAFKAATFREAYPAIADVLIRGGDLDLIDAQLGIWRKRKPTTEFTSRCLAHCIDALTAFKALLAKGAFKKCSFVGGMSEAYVELGGVSLSVRPEALVRGPEVGAVKIYLSKTMPFTRDAKGKPGSASYAAAALHLWAETELGGALAERCLVVDVFAGELYTAPIRNISRREDMEAACEEIVAGWATIKEPQVGPREAGAGGAP